MNVIGPLAEKTQPCLPSTCFWMVLKVTHARLGSLTCKRDMLACIRSRRPQANAVLTAATSSECY